MDDHKNNHSPKNTNHSPHTHILLVDQWLSETRMARVRHGVVEDFDQEIDSHRLKKGNIYMGRVMRIEPSLQAVFVDFGFDKHGFLAFSEIALPGETEAPVPATLPVASDDIVHEAMDPPLGDLGALGSLDDGEEPLTEGVSTEVTDLGAKTDQEASEPEIAETTASSATPERDQKGPQRSPKKLLAAVQAWVKANPLIMVQVTKDERGSKGAALSTFIALSGRYGFFLPNTPGSHGVSKKITAATTRQHLQQVLQSLDIPPGMSMILRSAAADRKKSEIKRDYDYMRHKWSTIQQSPQDHVGLVLEEDPLLIRCLRDSRLKEVGAIYVEGQALYKQARHYVRAVMPSYLPHLHLSEPGLFAAHHVEEQIASLYDAKVHLPSGGAIVIAPTEALVSIDVNSAKATQKKNVNDTALATNLEAAAMIARHLRLRDLAGLIVIDFIDLPSHKRSIVEKALKEALADDRAKIKIGKISEFGLLEMSRQCLRQSLMETNTTLCQACAGAGRLMSSAVQTLQALRNLERWARMAQGHHAVVCVSGTESVVLAIVNRHRSYVSDLEQRYGLMIQFELRASDSCSSASGLTLITPLEGLDTVALDKANHTTKAKKKKARRKKKNTSTEGVILLDPPISPLVENTHAPEEAFSTTHTSSTREADKEAVDSAGGVPVDKGGWDTGMDNKDRADPGALGTDTAEATLVKKGGKGGQRTHDRRHGRNRDMGRQKASGTQGISDDKGASRGMEVVDDAQGISAAKGMAHGQGVSGHTRAGDGQDVSKGAGQTEEAVGPGIWGESRSMESGTGSHESALMDFATSVVPELAPVTEEPTQAFTSPGWPSSGSVEVGGGASKRRRRGKTRAGHHTKDGSDALSVRAHSPHNAQEASSLMSLAHTSQTRTAAAQVANPSTPSTLISPAQSSSRQTQTSSDPVSATRSSTAHVASHRSSTASSASAQASSGAVPPPTKAQTTPTTSSVPRKALKDKTKRPSRTSSTSATLSTPLSLTVGEESASPRQPSTTSAPTSRQSRPGSALPKTHSPQASKSPARAKTSHTRSSPTASTPRSPSPDKSIILPPLVSPRKPSS